MLIVIKPMDKNIATIQAFYEAFSRLDHQAMNRLYANGIVFYDPMFENLEGESVRAMWEMLCRNARDFSLTYGEVEDLGDNYYRMPWQASYTFSKTGRRVTNKVMANMKVENGLIIEHSDGFSMHKWASQALGFFGHLLGWNSFYVRKVRNNARRGLLSFMQNPQ